MLAARKLRTCHINDAETSGDNGQSMVPIWFRVPELWDDYLETKAAKEYCSKSDLLRRAFRLTYGTDLEEFRVNPQEHSKARPDSPLPLEIGNPAERGFTQDKASIPALYDIKNDPWFESLAAFVANKRSPQTHRVYRVLLNQFFAAKRFSTSKELKRKSNPTAKKRIK